MGPPSERAADNAFDTIARGLAQGMSRRDALRKGGAAFVAAVAMSPSDALAKLTGRCPKHRVKCDGACCPAGEICIKPKHKKGKKAGKPKCGCPTHATRCKGSCVHTQTDVHNCGHCGHKCAHGQGCVHGRCECRTGQTVCAGTCTTLGHDRKNCGACHHACPSGKVCANGACATRCPAGTVVCAGGCVTIGDDPENCGKCGETCAFSQVCTNGVCANTCAAGQALCSGLCVNVTGDPRNCGKCGNVCSSGEVCTNGVCARTCPPGQTACSGSCVDLSNNPHNCGACGTFCAGGHVCANATCTNVCPSGTVDCSGACCRGNACCGSNCQTVHSNGVGQNYYDCNRLGTYNLAQAEQARAAFPLSGSFDTTPSTATCPSGGKIVSRANGSQCASWAYAGPFTGHVHLSTAAQGNGCVCPEASDPTWD